MMARYGLSLGVIKKAVSKIGDLRIKGEPEGSPFSGLNDGQLN
jgi:hypothetical protein